MGIREDLLVTEKRLWSGGKAEYEATLDDTCLVAFPQMAGVSTRSKVVEQVADEPRWHDLHVEIQGFLQPTDDVAILSYRARATRDTDAPHEALVSSAYVQRRDGWKLMFHQQTPTGAQAQGDRAKPTSEKERDETAIRELLARFTRALHDKDSASAIGTLVDDAVTFDLAPPLRMDAQATHDPAQLEQWFETWKGPIVSRSQELEIEVGGDIAYAYGLQHLTGTKRDGEEVDLWFRVTACLRREPDGRWRIAHMHNSVPFAMDGSRRALLDLKP